MKVAFFRGDKNRCTAINRVVTTDYRPDPRGETARAVTPCLKTEEVTSSLLQRDPVLNQLDGPLLIAGGLHINNKLLVNHPERSPVRILPDPVMPADAAGGEIPVNHHLLAGHRR